MYYIYLQYLIEDMFNMELGVKIYIPFTANNKREGRYKFV